MRLKNLKEKYTGKAASEYEKIRKSSEMWWREQKIVSQFLREICQKEKISLVMDVPVGTGRFFDIYEELSVNVLGIDVSEDMLNQARDKAKNRNITIRLVNEDILEFSEDINPDVIVCTRFLNWLDFKHCKRVISKLSSFYPTYIILGSRTLDLVIGRLLITPKDNLKAVINYLMGKRLGPNLKIHNKTDLENVFSSNQLEIKGKGLVDVGSFGSKYFIYLLKNIAR